MSEARGEPRLRDPVRERELVRDDASARTLTDILGDVVKDGQELIRGEAALLRTEMDRKIQTAILGLVWVFGGMFVGFAGLIVLLMALVYALSYVIPDWAAALIVGVVIVAIGGGLTMAGLKDLKPSELTPERTAESVSRDAQVVKEHL
jgi:hypothetical protein